MVTPHISAKTGWLSASRSRSNRRRPPIVSISFPFVLDMRYVCSLSFASSIRLQMKLTRTLRASRHAPRRHQIEHQENWKHLQRLGSCSWSQSRRRWRSHQRPQSFAPHRPPHLRNNRPGPRNCLAGPLPGIPHSPRRPAPTPRPHPGGSMTLSDRLEDWTYERLAVLSEKVLSEPAVRARLAQLAGQLHKDVRAIQAPCAHACRDSCPQSGEKLGPSLVRSLGLCRAQKSAPSRRD